MADYRSSVDEQNDKQLGFGNTIDQLDKLRQFFTQKQQFQQNLDAEGQRQQAGFQQQKDMVPLQEASQEKQKSFEEHLKEEAQARNLKSAQEIVDNNAKQGRKVNAKIGDVDVSQSEESPLKYLTRATQKDNDATAKAYMLYNQGLTKIKQGVDASKEGLDAVNDPKQTGSLGVVRSNMLRALGMNRYNGDEAAASLPPQLKQQFSAMFNNVAKGWSGTDVSAQDDNNPLTPQQKAAAESFFRGHIQNSLQSHEQLKNQSRGYLRSSGHFTPQTADTLESGFTQSGFDKYAGDIIAPKPGSVPANYQSPPPGAGQPPQQQGTVDKLKSLFGFGSSQGKQQSTQPQTMRVKHKASGQTGTIPANEFDPSQYEQVQ